MKNSLQEQIDNLELQRADLFRKKEPIDKELVRLYGEISELKKQQASEKEKVGFNDSDLLLYRPENDNSVYYSAATKLADEYGMNQSGYLNNTQRNGAFNRCFEVCFYRVEHPKGWTIKQQIDKVVEFLERAKKTFIPIKDGGIYLGVLENTLSEYGIYHLIISEDLKTAKRMKTTYGHTSELSSGSLRDMLKQTAEQNYYE